VSAGPSVEVDAGDTAYITEASAVDGDGTIETIAWTVLSSPDPTIDSTDITGADGLTPSIPTGVPGEYVLQMEATDDKGATSTATVSVWAVTITPKIQAITNPGGYTAVGGASLLDVLTDGDPATYARSSANPVNDTLTGELEPIPAGAKTFTTTLVNEVDSPVINAVLSILNRATGTTVATRPASNITTTEQDIVWELTPAENALVLDSHKLDIRIVANVAA